jgi:phospholipid/cholesterol/gamma-HCH transport system permease protein
LAQEKMNILRILHKWVAEIGEAIFFLKDIVVLILRGKVRGQEVLAQMYEQGVQSVVIVVLTSLASGMVLGLQGFITLQRFGAKEFISHLVGLSLVRELGPVFTALIFSGKAGAGITAELGTMNTHEQVEATRALGVNPLEFLVAPRFLACILVLPVLVVISEIVGVFGGYLVAVHEAHLPGVFYIRGTMDAIGYKDFFSGIIKVFFFSVIIGWICCYKGFYTKGGALGVGRFTTQAVAYSYISVIVSNMFLTKIILTLWG